MERFYIEDKKELLKQRVNFIIKYIDTKRQDEFKNIKEKIKDNGYTEYLTIFKIYKTNKDKMNKQQLEKLILNLIKMLDFNGHKGYFFINSANGTNIYSSKNNCRLTNAYFYKNTKKSEYFIETTQRNCKIIGFVKFFKPFNWYIGYAEPIDNLEKHLKRTVLEYLSKYRYGESKHGYIFAAEILNINGGGCFAKVVSNPNKPSIVGKCISDNTTDSKGTYYRKKILSDLRKQGYSMIEYYYKIPNSQQSGLKLSYVVVYKPWNWIIGTGYYLEDLRKSFIKLAMNDFKKNLKQKIVAIIVLSISILTFFVFIYLFIYGVLKKDISTIEEFFQNYPSKKRINTQKIRIDNLYTISKHINSMVNQIEEYSDKLKQTLARYEKLAETMPDAMFLYEKKENGIFITYLNRYAEKCFDRKKEELIGKNIEDVFIDKPFIIKKIKETFLNGLSIESSDCIIDNQSSKKRRYFSCITYKLSDREAVSIAKDVTDSVLLFKSMEQEKEKLNKFINIVNIGVVVADKSGKITYINDIAKNILEINKEEFGKNRIPEIIGLHNMKIIQNNIKAIKNNKGTCKNCNLTITTRSKNKKWLDMSIGSITINNEQMFIISFYDVTKRYLKEKEAEYIGFHDVLTGLYNRRYFEEEIKRLCNKRNYPLSLIMFDLNGLKIVNDMLGHKEGDNLIKRLADILTKQARANDIVSRIGGDEFTVIMPNTNKYGVLAFLERVENDIKLSNNNNDIYLSASFGYAIQEGQFDSIDKFFSAADSAMYQNKYSKHRMENLRKIIKSTKASNGSTIEDIVKKYDYR